VVVVECLVIGIMRHFDIQQYCSKNFIVQAQMF